MKTDELVKILATGVDAVDPAAPARRLATALGLGVLGAATLMVALLGVRHDLGHALTLPMFWVKFIYVAALAAAGVFALSRLARPGARLAWIAPALAAPVCAIWLLGGVEMSSADPAYRHELLLGETWKSCPWLIAMLSTPVFLALLWAVDGLAATQLRLAGAVTGFASGAIAAVVYALHCPEMGAPFLGIWYLIGMLVPTAVGALLGPRLLRW